MLIRNAVMDDLKQLAAVEKECFPPLEAATEKDIKERLTYYANHFWLLFDDNKL